MPNNNPNNNQQCELRIITWNAGGILNKITELEDHIHQYNIDIVLVSETHLTSSDSITIKKYDIYLANHPTNRRRGGSAIIINRNIDHMALPKISTLAIQCVPICVTFPDQPLLKIAAIYCPPLRGLTSEAFNLIFKLLEPRFLIAGDWNAKHRWWGNTRACNRGNELITSLRTHNYNILATGSPTHFPYDQRKRPSAIDFAIYCGIQHDRLHIKSSLDLGSDHLPLLMNLLSKPEVIPFKKPMLPANASTKKFQLWLDQNIHLNTEITSGQDIEDAVDILTRNIHQAATYASTTSPRLPINSRFRIHYTPNRRIQNMLIVKRYFKYKHLILRNNTAKRLHKITSKRLKKALEDQKTRRLDRTLQSIDPKDRYSMQKLWRFTKQIKRQPAPNLPVRSHNTTTDQNNNQSINNWCKTTLEKAEAFANHLESRFKPFLLNTDEERQNITSQITTPSPTDNPRFRPVTLPEIKNLIKGLENNKAPGLDRIDNKTIKALPDRALLYLILIFNNSLRLGHFPQQWKTAIVTMIPKPGKPTELLASYRPISLLSGLSKILERILLKRMYESRNFTNAIPSHQFGFRYKHNTEQQLARVTQFILKAYEANNYCSAVFLDIQEAFDRVWHPGLFYKLKSLLSPILYATICHYLTNRTFMVECHEGARSTPKVITAGVPQGSVLGPILYTIYTSDLPTPDTNLINLSQNITALLATYADDTVVMSAARTATTAICQVEGMLEPLTEWTNKWCIKINPNKTAHVLFSLKNENIHVIAPKIMNQTIETKDSHPYLGVILDKKLNFCKHTANLVTKLKARRTKLDWLLNNNSKLPTNSKILLYKQLIAPVWHYALPIWGALTSQTQINRVAAFQSTTIRKITNAPWLTRNSTLHSDLKIPTFEETYDKTSTKYANQISHHSNTEITKLITKPYIPFRLARSHERYLEHVNKYIKPLRQYITQTPPTNNQLTLLQQADYYERLQNHKQQILQRTTTLRSSLPYNPDSTERYFTLRFPMSANRINQINHELRALNNELQIVERIIESLRPPNGPITQTLTQPNPSLLQDIASIQLITNQLTQ